MTKFETCLRQHNVWFWFILSVGLKKLWDEDDFEQRRHALHASRLMYKYKLQMCNLLPSGIKCKQQKDKEKMLPTPFPKRGKGNFSLGNFFLSMTNKTWYFSHLHKILFFEPRCHYQVLWKNNRKLCSADFKNVHWGGINNFW